MLFYLVIAIFVAIVLSLVRTKKSHFIFGCSVLAAGVSILLYGYFSPPPRIEDYFVTRIRYENCYFDRDEQDIILVSESKMYAIPRRLVEKSTTVDNAISDLCTETEADVWLPKTSGRIKVVRGVETAKMRIPVEDGLELEMDKPSEFIGLGWLFVLLGGLLCVATLILGDSIYDYINF